MDEDAAMQGVVERVDVIAHSAMTSPLWDQDDRAAPHPRIPTPAT